MCTGGISIHSEEEESFRVTLLIEDETDQAHAVLMGKEAEEICGISCEDLIIKKNCKNQRIIPQEILQLEGQIKLLKLKPGTKRDFLIKGIYEDVHKFTPTQDIEPTTSTPNKKIFEKKRKELFKAKPSKNPKSDNFEPSDQTSANTSAQSDTEDLI
ncbi:uncharacterized protein LOC133725825 [Rosa rugosa]|uniref:uncharacterized protein LOC133725825 n=1 Tax=Rosa rugosa TaxID=74645 RepID=UPI002B4031E6|nr:uncharacterized protein LOC133725825 [Rosa rugosa]XP_062009187.1 uncharacterized protein LOC133725825 [Rosa rugosa]